MTSTRTLRIAALAGALGLVALSLSGCIKVDAAVTVNPDATGTGTFAFELQKEAAGFLGISDLPSFTSQISEGDVTGNNGLGTFDSCESSESETGFVYSCTFTTMAFTSTDDAPWTITKEGELLTFRMVSDAQQDPAAAEQNPLGDTNMGSISVDVTFPGPITSASGKGVTQTSDTTATIKGSLTETIDATITAEAGGTGSTLSLLLWLLVVVAVIALVAIVAVVLIMRRRSGPAATDSSEGDASPEGKD